ncbi:hypothetical protein C0993_008295 [Termitomyces sp. T159_Od127]|nr:hypothetical protein C0993_008295 [Termitomyces sp. T159_Od127]
MGGGARYPYPKFVWSPAGMSTDLVMHWASKVYWSTQVVGGLGHLIGGQTLLLLSEEY